MGITLADGEKLLNVPAQDRWFSLKDVDWSRSCTKTYYERRGFIAHLLVNFSRVGALIFGMYFTYLASILAPIIWNNVTNPSGLITGKPIPNSLFISVLSVGGAISVLITLFAICTEWFYLPVSARNNRILFKRFGIYFILFIFCVVPLCNIFVFDYDTPPATILAAVGVLTNVIGLGFSVLVAPASIVEEKIYNVDFVGNFTPMTSRQKVLSILMWSLCFISKFIESYYIIFTPVAEVLNLIIGLNTNTCLGGSTLPCEMVRWLLMGILNIMLMTFFFLDSYVWWLLWSAIVQYALSSFRIFKLFNWRKDFASLPDKMFPRLFAVKDANILIHPRILYAQLWNAIVDSLKEDHLINAYQQDNLKFTDLTLLKPVDADEMAIKEPIFIRRVKSSTSLAATINNDSSYPLEKSKSMSSNLTPYNLTASKDIDTESLVTLSMPLESPFSDPAYLQSLKQGASKIQFFPLNSEAERRLKFFAHSLDMEFPEPTSVEKMPAFTVLIPHYHEKLVMGFEDLTKRSETSSFNMLKYLQMLHPHDWENFVQECNDMLLENEDDSKSFISTVSRGDLDPENPSSFPPSLILKTRLWASRRCQTLYRTINGFSKYYDALSVLCKLEYSQQLEKLPTELRDAEVHRLVTEKVRIVVSIQRYADMNQQEKDDVNIIVNAHPELNVVYPERVTDSDGVERVFTFMFDGFCDKDEHGNFIPKMQQELPGWPILGDGKGCNQNHGAFWTRGEIIQVVDANQDNYMEECLKVRSILAEFKTQPRQTPVALVGLREHVMSSGIGAVAEIGATNETNLVTLNQPILNKLGCRMHYGHPDFWNSVYAFTRGGVSKAQKGLHLNEEIYAAMNVLMRGGINKHAEYIQCGKGRDLGLNSVLGFFSKLANGMSEQILSREYYRIGTGLNLDRLFTFFYANPAYVLNTIGAILSMQLFLLVVVCMSSLANNLVACVKYQQLSNGAFLNYGDPNCVILSPWSQWQVKVVLTLYVFFIILFHKMHVH